MQAGVQCDEQYTLHTANAQRPTCNWRVHLRNKHAFAQSLVVSQDAFAAAEQALQAGASLCPYCLAQRHVGVQRPLRTWSPPTISY